MKLEQLKNISIRLAQPEDAEQILLVNLLAIRTLSAKDYTPEQIKAFAGDSDEPSNCDNMRQTIIENKLINFVAELNGKIVGDAYFRDNEIYGIYVHPDYVRQKIGTRLLNTLEKEAVARNISKMMVSASITGLPFYEANGYQIVQRPYYIYPNGVQLECIYMEKYL
jgi:putative acetyltransferase